MKMKFAVNLDNNKVIDNLLIYLVLNFHSNRPNDLRVIAIGSSLLVLLAVWIDLED
jgi:hypothetical protein